MPRKEEVRLDITGRDRASGVVSRIGNTLSRLKNAVFSVQGAIVAIGGAAVLRTLGGLLNAFSEQEDAVEGLRAALNAAGKDGDQALGVLAQRASELQQITKAGDEATLQATATLVSLAKQLTTSELADAQTAIIGLADQFFRGDLNQAALQLGKAIGSSTNSLSRYGITVDTSASQSQKLAQILTQTSGFFAVAQARAGTLRGQLTQLSNAWGDLRERLGQFLAESPVARAFITQLKDLVVNVTTTLSGSAEDIRDLFADLGSLAGTAFRVALINALETIGDALGNVRQAVHERFVRGLLEPFGFDVDALLARSAEVDRQLSSLARTGRPADAHASFTGAASAPAGMLGRLEERDRQALMTILQRISDRADRIAEGLAPAPGAGTGDRNPLVRPDVNIPGLRIPRLESGALVPSSGGSFQPTPGLSELFPAQQASPFDPEVVNAFQDLVRSQSELNPLFDHLLDLQSAQKDVLAQITTPQERYNAATREIQNLYDRGLLTLDQYERALAQQDAALKQSAKNVSGFAITAIGVTSQLIAQLVGGDRGPAGILGGILGAAGAIAGLGTPLGAALAGGGAIVSALGSRRDEPVDVNIRSVDPGAYQEMLPPLIITNNTIFDGVVADSVTRRVAARLVRLGQTDGIDRFGLGGIGR